jgi:hypothetical protein
VIYILDVTLGKVVGCRAFVVRLKGDMIRLRTCGMSESTSTVILDGILQYGTATHMLAWWARKVSICPSHAVTAMQCY